jgi:hypothetical protein
MQVSDEVSRRGPKEAQHVHGHPVHGTRPIRPLGKPCRPLYRASDQVLPVSIARRLAILARGTDSSKDLDRRTLT